MKTSENHDIKLSQISPLIPKSQKYLREIYGVYSMHYTVVDFRYNKLLGPSEITLLIEILLYTWVAKTTKYKEIWKFGTKKTTLLYREPEVFFIKRVHRTHLHHECSFLTLKNYPNCWWVLWLKLLSLVIFIIFSILTFMTYQSMMQIVQSRAFGPAHPWNSLDLFPLTSIIINYYYN